MSNRYQRERIRDYVWNIFNGGYTMIPGYDEKYINEQCITQLNFTEETLETKMVTISDTLFTERSVTRAYVETIILFSMKVDKYCKKHNFSWYETEMLLDIVVNILEYHNYNVPYKYSCVLL